jgi:hypothetical protein
VRIQHNDGREEPRTYFYVITVKTRRFIDRCHVDVVIPDSDESAILATTQHTGSFIDSFNVKVVTGKGNGTEEENPSDNCFSFVPLIISILNDGHAEQAAGHTAKDGWRLHRTPDSIGWSVQQLPCQ